MREVLLGNNEVMWIVIRIGTALDVMNAFHCRGYAPGFGLDETQGKIDLSTSSNTRNLATAR